MINDLCNDDVGTAQLATARQTTDYVHHLSLNESLPFFPILQTFRKIMSRVFSCDPKNRKSLPTSFPIYTYVGLDRRALVNYLLNLIPTEFQPFRANDARPSCCLHVGVYLSEGLRQPGCCLPDDL
jgi:hypothetical protein